MRRMTSLIILASLTALLVGCYSARLSEPERAYFWSLEEYSPEDVVSEEVEPFVLQRVAGRPNLP